VFADGTIIDLVHFLACACWTRRLTAGFAIELGWLYELLTWPTSSGAPFGGNEDLESNEAGATWAQGCGILQGLGLEDEYPELFVCWLEVRYGRIERLLDEALMEKLREQKAAIGELPAPNSDARGPCEGPTEGGELGF
jgi:hypothetical protein